MSRLRLRRPAAVCLTWLCLHALHANGPIAAGADEPAKTVANSAASTEPATTPGYGTLTGQFLLQGTVPDRRLLFGPGDDVKDAAVCAATKHFDQTLVVDAKSRGIANIVVYLRKVSRIHPDLQSTPEKDRKLSFLMQNCEFHPHILKVRTDQTVLVKSPDKIPHNTHAHPFANEEIGYVVRPGDLEGVPVEYDEPEMLPVKVTCDLHPHMTAYWVVLDHPYVAITDSRGRFTIEKLPAGTYDFIVWHERAGYLDRKNDNIQDALDVTIESGTTTDVGQVDVPVELLTAAKR